MISLTLLVCSYHTPLELVFLAEDETVNGGYSLNLPTVKMVRIKIQLDDTKINLFMIVYKDLFKQISNVKHFWENKSLGKGKVLTDNDVLRVESIVNGAILGVVNVEKLKSNDQPEKNLQNLIIENSKYQNFDPNSVLGLIVKKANLESIWMTEKRIRERIQEAYTIL